MEKLNKEEVYATIDEYLTQIEAGFKQKKKRIPYNTICSLMKDLSDLMSVYDTLDTKKCSKLAICRVIPVLNVLIKYDKAQENLIFYHDFLKQAYTYGARIDFEHFLIRYEWDLKDKVYEPRKEILRSYVFFLNYMCYHRDFQTIICNLPSGYGKTRIEKLYEAFRLGLDPSGTFLSICSNDNVVKSSSRSVINIIKSEEYGEIFPQLNYERDKKLFDKETDERWRLKYCGLGATYLTYSRGSNAVGERANLSIHLDDMYADPAEALDMNLNRKLWDNYQTVWTQRYCKGMTPQMVITGTLWSPYDLLSQIIHTLESEHKFFYMKNFKFTRISEDKHHVIIQVPALDPDTGESTCPKLVSTEELLRKKRNISNYLWQCNFQQQPIPPDGLAFDYKNLRTYTTIPVNESNYTKASLDPARKGHDYLAMGIYQDYGDDYALVDCLFERKAITELYDKIVDKIIEDHVILLVLEENIDSSLKSILESKLEEREYYACKIVPLYNTVKKETRIQGEEGVIKRRIVFPAQGMFGMATEMGQFMDQITMYSFNMPNKFDDALDSVAMFSREVIQENSKPNKITPIPRPF